MMTKKTNGKKREQKQIHAYMDTCFMTKVALQWDKEKEWSLESSGELCEKN